MDARRAAVFSRPGYPRSRRAHGCLTFSAWSPANLSRDHRETQAGRKKTREKSAEKIALAKKSADKSRGIKVPEPQVAATPAAGGRRPDVEKPDGRRGTPRSRGAPGRDCGFLKNPFLVIGVAGDWRRGYGALWLSGPAPAPALWPRGRGAGVGALPGMRARGRAIDFRRLCFGAASVR